MKNGFAELGSVAEFINGAAFKPEDWGDEGKRIIRIQNLTDSTKPFNRTTREVADKLHVQRGDLLVSWSASLGVFEWTDPEVALLNQHIFRVVPDKVRVEKRYLRHGLEGALLEMQRHLHGATMQHVNRGEFLATKLYLPPLAEQRRIAEMLDRAEALRAKRRAALAQLGSLTQSLFLDLFGDPLAKNGGGAHVPFESVTRRITYGFTCPMKHLDSGIPIITAKNVRDGFIDFENVHYADQSEFDALTAKSKPARGDVLITKDGTIGRCAVVERDESFCINQSVALVQPDHGKVIPSYMLSYLSSNRVQQVMKNMGKGNSLAHLQITELAELPMPLPPISLQREFARRVTAVEALKTAQSASLAEMNALFATLQHRAFRGEL